MFNRDKDGIIIGFCNDSFSMSYRYNCVHIWNNPPNHYFKPQLGDFIICLNRKYDDVEVYSLNKEHHTFKGNYMFRQKNKTTVGDNWCIYKDIGNAKIGEKT